MSLSPVIKWVGGKRQIMNAIISKFPEDFYNYYELFLGGGSVVMELSNKGRLTGKQVILSDKMEPLIIMYRVIKTSPEELMRELDKETYKHTQENYVLNRQLFNELKESVSEEKYVQLAALFIFLNKSGFNGMYRENQRGIFNVPFGKQQNRKLYDTDAILRLNAFLNDPNVTINCSSFESCNDQLGVGDFVYCDPPYHGTFVGYSSSIFGEIEQTNLKYFMDECTRKGVKVAISNSNTVFITNLYSGYNIHVINVKRLINSRGDKRKEFQQEVLITNY